MSPPTHAGPPAESAQRDASNGSHLDRHTEEWIAKLPATIEEGIAASFDGRAWLAGFLKASAVQRADETYLGLGGFMAGGDKTEEDLLEFIYARGLVGLEAWGATMVSIGADGEVWAREAANDYAMAFKNRIEFLMETASVGGAA